MSRSHREGSSQSPSIWCAGSMTAVFDAALDGDRTAIAAALQVCAGCPMLAQCRRNADEAAQNMPRARRPVGVQGGRYYEPGSRWSARELAEEVHLTAAPTSRSPRRPKTPVLIPAP